jgi:hypothetical protein
MFVRAVPHLLCSAAAMRSIRMKHLGLWAAVLWITCVSPAFGRAPAPQGNDLAPQSPSACIAWGKPLRGGPIRAVLIAPRFTLLDAEELAQRFDVELTTVPLWDAHHAGCDPSDPEGCLPGSTAEEVWQQVRGALAKKLEVILAANFDLAMIPEDISRVLVDRVNAGCGLILAHHEPGADSPLQTLIEALDPADGEADILRGTAVVAPAAGQDVPRTLSTAMLGEGRIVQFHYPGNPPRSHCLIGLPSDTSLLTPGLEEDSFSLVARAVRWAARRMPETAIAAIAGAAPSGPSEEEIPPDLPAAYIRAMRDSVLGPATQPFVLDLAPPADRDYEVTVQARRPEDLPEVSYTFKSILPKGSTRYAFELPLGTGEFLLDAWLKDKKGITDWFTQPLVVPGWPEFSNLSFSKEYVLPHDTLEVRVEVRPVLSESRSCTLYARAFDLLSTPAMPGGRLVSENSMVVTHEGGRFDLRLNFADLIAPLLRIEVFALEGAVRTVPHTALTQAYREVKYLPVRLPRQTASFEFVAVEPSVDEFNLERYSRVLAGYGVTTLVAPNHPAALRQVSESGLRFLPQLAEYCVPGAVDGVYREPCLNDPAYRQAEKMRLEDAARDCWAGASGRYSLGSGCLVASDETVCRCVHCMAGFRDVLKRDYPKLAALNAAWGTTFSAWEDVSLDGFPPTVEGLPEVVQRDFRRFMDASFAAFHGFAREAIRAVDREAKVGFRALPGNRPSLGYDWEALMQNLDFAAIDPDPLLIEEFCSLRVPGSAAGLCFGDSYLPDSVQGRWLPWLAALHQFPSVWCMRPFGGRDEAAPFALLTPEGRLNERYQPLIQNITELEAGLGALLLAATPSPAETPGELSTSLSLRERGGVRALSRDVDPPRQPFQGTQHRFRFGEAELWAWLADPGADSDKQEVRFSAPKTSTVYNLRTGTTVRRPQKGGLRLERGEAALVSVLPYALDDLTLSAPGQVPQGRRLPIRVQVTAGDREPGDHLVSISLAPRGGRALEHYRKTLPCKKGVGDTFLPLAHNETSGWYVLSATDLLTGTRRSASVRVLAAAASPPNPGGSAGAEEPRTRPPEKGSAE